MNIHYTTLLNLIKHLEDCSLMRTLISNSIIFSDFYYAARDISLNGLDSEEIPRALRSRLC